jgi:hypothetical protein
MTFFFAIAIAQSLSIEIDSKDVFESIEFIANNTLDKIIYGIYTISFILFFPQMFHIFEFRSSDTLKKKVLGLLQSIS